MTWSLVGYSGVAGYVNDTVATVFNDIGQHRRYLVSLGSWAEAQKRPVTGDFIRMCGIAEECYYGDGASRFLTDLLQLALRALWAEVLDRLPARVGEVLLRPPPGAAGEGEALRAPFAAMDLGALEALARLLLLADCCDR